MFIYSVRASTVKFFAFVLVAVALVIGVVGFSTDAAVSASASGEVDFTGIKTKEDRLEFMSRLGIKVADSEDSQSFVIPKSFDRVILGYNEIQKKQGLDVSKYTRKKINGKEIKVPEDECLVFEKNHEAIIDDKIFLRWRKVCMTSIF